MGEGFNPIYDKPILSPNCIAMPTCPFICMNGHVGTVMPVFGRPKSLMGNGQKQAKQTKPEITVHCFQISAQTIMMGRLRSLYC